MDKGLMCDFGESTKAAIVLQENDKPWFFFPAMKNWWEDDQTQYPKVWCEKLGWFPDMMWIAFLK